MRGFGQKAYWTSETMLTMDKGSSLLVPLMRRRQQLPFGSNGLPPCGLPRAVASHSLSRTQSPARNKKP